MRERSLKYQLDSLYRAPRSSLPVDSKKGVGLQSLALFQVFPHCGLLVFDSYETVDGGKQLLHIR